jgi:Cu-Zn family superoxide dismutase
MGLNTISSIGGKIAISAAIMFALSSMPAVAQTANAALKSADGKDVGSVTLTQTPAGVLLKLSVKGLPEGEHAFHVHAVGKCEAPFTTAGGHFNPGAKKHGMMAAEGHHAGDMPNLHIPANGALVIEVLNPSITLDKGKPDSVFDADGSAVIIHAGKDDYKPTRPATPVAALPAA